jgi:hypothetical protein
VEAGGVEPPSENIPLKYLHIYPDIKVSPLAPHQAKLPWD